jgi:hypothetical protein
MPVRVQHVPMLLHRNSTSRVYRHAPAVTIRWATPADARSVQILAELDDAPVPPGPLLLAFAGDELWVAVSLATGAAICDPFRPSAEVAALVRERARQLSVPEPRRPRLGPMRWQRRLPETG